MIESDYRRDTHHSYLVLYEKEQEAESSFRRRMFLENRIPGLLACRMHLIDQKAHFQYDISSRQSLVSILETRAMDGELLERLLTSILHTLNSLQDFLLDTDGLSLKPEWIYYSPSGKEFAFCYFPEGKYEWKEQLQQLAEYLLPRLEHKNRDAVRLGYSFYQTVMEDKITAAELEVLLGKEQKEEKEKREKREELLNAFFGPDDPEQRELQHPGRRNREQAAKSAEHPAEKAESGFSLHFPEEKEAEPHRLASVRKWLQILWPLPLGGVAGAVLGWLGYFLPAIFSGVAAVAVVLLLLGLRWQKNREKETDSAMEQYIMVQDWLEEEEQEEKMLENGTLKGSAEAEASAVQEEAATCLLTGEAAYSALAPGYLIPESGSGEPTIAVNRNVTMIGKSSQMDVKLHFPGISRIHARIINRDGHCFLSDLNSRNGTRLNGKLLKPEEEQLLADGDRIRFADREYEWRCYRR